MELILHIGTEKTGTTTTQHWAARNRDALMRQGVVYSSVLGSVSHIKLYLCCLLNDRQDEGFQRLNISSAAERQEFRTRLPIEFAAEVSAARKSGCRTFLISDELCHSRLVTPEEVQNAKEFLAPHFDEISVLCALRPQIDVAVSRTSNVAKGRDRMTKQYFEKIGPESPYYNYKRLVERWSTAFGAANVNLVPFRRTPDFTEVVAARAGIDTAELQPPVRFNEALDIRVMAMTNAMKGQPVEGRWIEPFAYIPLDMLSLLPCRERLHPGLELARSVQARFEESNRNLTNGRIDLEMADLEPDWSRYEDRSNLDVLEQPCAFSRELAALVQLFNQNLALARAQNEIAQSERHLELNRSLAARRCLEAAQRLIALLRQSGISSQRIRKLEGRGAAIEQTLETGGDEATGKERRAAKKQRREKRKGSRSQQPADVL